MTMRKYLSKKKETKKNSSHAGLFRSIRFLLQTYTNLRYDDDELDV